MLGMIIVTVIGIAAIVVLSQGRIERDGVSYVVSKEIE